MLLPDDLVERLRPQRVGERRNRLRATEKVRRHRLLFAEDVGTLGRIELELGRVDLGIALELEKRSTVVWPKLSVSCIASRPLALKPMRTRSKPASRSRGVASSHSSPSFSPASESANAFSTPVPPASSAAGVEPIAAES